MFALGLLFLLAVPAFAKEEDILKSWIKILEDCNIKIKARAFAIENILFGRNIDDSREGQCLLKCSFVKAGVMMEDGTFLPDKFLVLVKKAYPQIPPAILQDIHEHCISKHNDSTDPCGKAYGYFSCVRGERENDAFNHTEKVLLDIEECNKEIKAPQNVVDMVITGDLDDSEKGKCLIQCIYQLWGFINKDGSRTAETEQVFKSMEYHDPSASRIKIASDNCAKKYNGGGGSCDNGYNYVKCIFDSEDTFDL